MSQRSCDCIELSKWVRSSDKNSKIDSVHDFYTLMLNLESI